MKRSTVACLAALAFSCATPHIAQVELTFPQQPEREVQVPSSGPRVLTGAKLYAPAGPGPFPAVVLSHGSGGLRQHVFEWAQKFLAAGYVVLVVDHLGPRGKSTNTDFSVSVTEYAQDDIAAMRHLRSLPFVDGRRIVQMGFSYGGMAGLRAASRDFRAKRLGGEQFAAIISVYPWCAHRGGQEFRDHHWNFFNDTDIPLLVVVGADDDDSDPRSCIRIAQANAAKGLPVELKVLPGATHQFDHSWRGDRASVQQLGGGRTATYRYNREAVEATWKLTLDFVERRVGGSGTR